MAFPKLISTIHIELIDFSSFIIIDENNLEAFAIYMQNETKPFVIFKQDPYLDRVEIIINTDLFEEVQLKKSKDKELRKKYWKKLVEYILNSEQVARELVFKDKKLNYITDIALLKNLENRYINE